jgi:multimeric flavodoxin WrbA
MVAKVLGILGSPRRDGNCAWLLERLLGRLSGRCDTASIALRDVEIRPCEGCHRCENGSGCVLEDDMQALAEELRAADVLVLASPAYMGGVTSRMRAFMERTWPLRKGTLAGKIGSYIVVGRRKPGAAVYALEDYLGRVGTIRVPGVLGYGFRPGDVCDDAEAVRAVDALAAALLGMATAGETRPDAVGLRAPAGGRSRGPTA